MPAPNRFRSEVSLQRSSLATTVATTVVAAVAGFASGCTPVGIWLYQEPHVRLHEIRLEVDNEAEPFGVVLSVNNPNDFPITVTHVEMVVTLDGRPVGHGEQSESTTLPDRQERQVGLPVALEATSAAEVQSRLSHGKHKYQISGRVTVGTPIGGRRFPFVITGSGTFGATTGSLAEPAARLDLALR